jgi:hypothetical protein
MTSPLDPKRINRLLFGVYFEDDIYERFCRKFPRLMRLFWWRMDPVFRRRNLLFIHVPRAAGMSVARALGAAGTRHYSARYFATIDPGWFAATPSFALIRDPIDRFISGYSYMRAAGAEGVHMAAVIADQTRHITSVDAYLDYLESRDVFDLDFVMRPQCWFVTDLDGQVMVKKLFILGEDDAALAEYLKPQGIDAIPHVNRSRRQTLELTDAQRRRVEKIYAGDFALIDSLRAQRAAAAANGNFAAE